MPTLLKFLVSIVLTLTLMPNAHSIWFEANGQAQIQNGNEQVARQRATQEAIKQALLFAGASVKSVQHMANGLLQDDRFEVRASGEVNTIELINEIYQDGYVTVAIRADIFPQESLCRASDYKKNIITTWYPFKYKQQASVGNMHAFGRIIAEKLQQEFEQYSQHAKIKNVEPYYLFPEPALRAKRALEIAHKGGGQFVLFAEIADFSVEAPHNYKVAFWQDDTVKRNFALKTSLYDGTTGYIVSTQELNFNAPWEFDLHQHVEINSQTLWQSSFGLNMKSLLQDLSQQIDKSLRCLPAYGKVLYVSDGQLTVNIGSNEGVTMGDDLTLFQLSQFYDQTGTIHQQFQIHPEKVQVRQVFAETAIVVSSSGAPLANIQANDFVARR
ncbi:MAG: hypothetical protein ACI88A_003120 [Paraglaciecola sp.]|jgi:hypothetical protein